jgi:hypothetical protein
MAVLDANFALGCGPGTHYTKIYIFQYMLERTDATTNEVLEPTTFVLAHPTVFTIRQEALHPERFGSPSMS